MWHKDNNAASIHLDHRWLIRHSANFNPLLILQRMHLKGGRECAMPVEARIGLMVKVQLPWPVSSLLKGIII